MAMNGEMKSLRDMENKVNTYFAQCAEQDTFPDEAGLILFLGISEEMYEKYMSCRLKRYKPFALCLERARLRRESILVRDIYASAARTPTGKMFLARQAENGGLTDKPKKEDTRVKKEAKKEIVELRIGSGSAYFE
jgi:hypothetical protein